MTKDETIEMMKRSIIDLQLQRATCLTEVEQSNKERDEARETISEMKRRIDNLYEFILNHKLGIKLGRFLSTRNDPLEESKPITERKK